MSNTIPKHRPRLATLTEVINILRDALRDFAIFNISKEDILQYYSLSVAHSCKYKREKLEKIQKGESDIRNIIDIDIALRHQFRSQILLKRKRELLRSMRGMDIYRNWVHYPDIEDICDMHFNKALNRICNLLRRMGKTEEARIVESLRLNPFFQSYYLYHMQLDSNNTSNPV